MSDSSIIQSEAKYEKVLKEYDHLQIQFKEQGGYQFEADIRSVLHGLNFQTFDYDTKIASLKWWSKNPLSTWETIIIKTRHLNFG